MTAAVVFGLFGWYLAGITVPYFPESNAPDFWVAAAALTGVVLGWQICGSRAGNGYNAATGVGISTAVAMALVILFILGFNQMIKNAMRLRYDGPTESVVDVFNLMYEHGLYFADVSIGVTLLVGGIICAWLTEFVGRRFP